jgi:hypothetical protein
MKFQIFHHSKNIIFKKDPLKETQNPSRYNNTLIITNLKFQHKPKKSSFKKSSNKNRSIIYYLVRGQFFFKTREIKIFENSKMK